MFLNVYEQLYTKNYMDLSNDFTYNNNFIFFYIIVFPCVNNCVQESSNVIYHTYMSYCIDDGKS